MLLFLSQYSTTPSHAGKCYRKKYWHACPCYSDNLYAYSGYLVPHHSWKIEGTCLALTLEYSTICCRLEECSSALPNTVGFQKLGLVNVNADPVLYCHFELLLNLKLRPLHVVHEEYDRVNSLEGSGINQCIHIYRSAIRPTYNSRTDYTISLRRLAILHTLPCPPVEHLSSLDNCRALLVKSAASGSFGVIDSARNVVYVMSWALYAS